MICDNLRRITQLRGETTINAKIKKVVLFLAKVLITVAIFVAIARAVDLKDAFGALKSARPELLVAAIIMQMLSIVTAATRWKLMMRALKYDPGRGFFFKSLFKANFFNQALPTSVGGDVIRIVDLSYTGYPKKEAVYSVLIDRIIGVSGLLLLNLLAILLGAGRFPDQLTGPLLTVVILLMAGVLAFFFIRDLKFLAHIKFLSYAHEISSHLRTVFSSVTVSIQLIVLCLLVHLFSSAAIYMLGCAVGFTYDLIIYMVLVPPVFLMMLLPISLAGWGVREGGLVALFMFVNADKATTLVVSLLYGLALIIASLPGAWFYLTTPQKEHYREALSDEDE